MATAIGDLVVRLGMDSKAFNRGMSASRDMLKQFGIVATATAAAGGALVAMAIRQANAMDAIGKHALRLGIATEALVGLQHQAELAGASADTLDSSLVKMAKNIGEAVLLGTGDAKDALEALRLDPRELVGKTPEAQFGAIADAMKRLQSQAERTAVATKIFGRSGAELLPMLAGGSKAIREAAEDAKYLGVAFSGVDAAKVAMVSDEWFRVRQSITGIKNSLTVSLAPSLTAAATGLATFFAEVRKSGPVLARTFMDGATAVAAFGDALHLALQKFLEGETMMAWFRAKTAELIGKPQSEINALREEYGDLYRRLREVQSQDWGAQLRESYQRVTQAIAGAGAAAEAAKGPIQAALDAPQTASSKAIDLIAEWRKQIGQFDMTDRQKAIADLGGTLEMGLGGALQELDRQLTELEKHREAIKAMEDAQRERENIAKGYNERFKDPLQRYLDEVKRIRSVASMLAPGVAEKAIAQAQKDFENADKGFSSGPRYGAAAERGSREAYSILVNSRKDDGTKKLVNINTKQLDALNRIDRNLQTEQRISIPNV